jgi:hypothetical protein
VSWNTYANSLLSSTLLIMGVDVTIDAITESYYAPVAVTLLVSFMLLMGVILLNLLIAIMSDKHGEVKAQELASANYNRASIVVEYEKLMSAADRKRPEYSPKYLHVLRTERIVEKDEKSQEIQSLEQLVHDKADELKEENADMKAELKAENAELRKMLQTQMQSTGELKDLLTKLLLEGKDISANTSS